MGEIVAGIVLGPSLLGYFFPEFSATLFPPESLMNLNLLSQIGLVLFMFVIGLELDFSVIKDKLNETLVISHAGNRGSFFPRSSSCHLGIRRLRGTASGISTFCHVHRDKHEYHGLSRVGPDRAGT